MTEMRATSLGELREYAKGKLLRLPDIAPGMPLYVFMKRPSLLDLISQGRIPNPLASTASKLFSKGGAGVDQTDPAQLKELTNILHIFCEASFVEPTYTEIKEAGLDLTDEQLMFVFNYVQAGNKALEKFRVQQKDPEYNRDGAEVQDNPSGTSVSE